MQNDLMTYDEVATYFRVEARTIKRWVNQAKETGFPKPIRLTKKCVYFKRAEVQRWVDGKKD